MERAGRVNEASSAVERVLRLIRYVSDGGETDNLSAAARGTGINRLTLMRLLAELEEHGALERVNGGGHQLGTSFLTLAASALAGHDLTSMAQRILPGLTEELGLSAYLVVLDGRDVVYLLRTVPDSPLVCNISLGSRVRAHLTTPGRMLLAHLDTTDLAPLVGPEPLPTASDQSPTTHRQLRELLTGDLQHGCAWSFSGYETGINSCAAAVFDAGGAAIAAISVAGPATRFESEPSMREQTEEAVRHSASELSSMLAAITV